MFSTSQLDAEMGSDEIEENAELYLYRCKDEEFIVESFAVRGDDGAVCCTAELHEVGLTTSQGELIFS